MATNKDFRKFPPKKVTSRDGDQIFFKKINDDFPSALYHYGQDLDGNPGYREMYPSVYSIELPKKYGYTKLYDFFVEEYFENRGLITYEQYNLYNYIATLRNRGYYLSLKGSNGGRTDGEIKGLAKMVRARVPDLTADIDHLEDCLLLHRVRRLDLQGMPNELVVHTPFTPDQLTAGKQKLIVDRISRQATKTKRQGAMVKGDSESGQKFNYLDRSRGNEHCFWLDYNYVKKAFGDKSKAFADFALAFFKKFLHWLKQDKSGFDADYRDALKHQLDRWGIKGNEQRETCYIAANKFRTIYCPLEQELIA
jgi:hypothetical protein